MLRNERPADRHGSASPVKSATIRPPWDEIRRGVEHEAPSCWPRIGFMMRHAFAIALTSLLVLVACATAQPEDEEGGELAQLLTTGASTSFVCGKAIDGTIGCVCDRNSNGDAITSCIGMSELCDLIGPGMTCDINDICRCIVGPTEPQPEPKARDNGEQIIKCISACDEHHGNNWCDWYCDCTVNQGRDPIKCDVENPYIDLHETPPLEPLKGVQLGNDSFKLP
jgi:hypothetical protein